MADPISTRNFQGDPISGLSRVQPRLAVYAVHDSQTKGRKYPEAPHPYRGPFQRDRDRIVHCAAFRRLQDKTQVFVGDLGDYHRTRLTHTLEVASIARTLGRALQLNEDLIEALALAHDLGHPPFGHAGEDTLNACLAGEGGFSHNQHALRIVELLEQRYQEFPGLNLSLEVLLSQESRIKSAPSKAGSLLEAQCVDAADSVAYNTHDADDALELGLLTLPDLLEIPLWQEAARRAKCLYASLSAAELRRAALHELIDWQVTDLLRTTLANLAERQVQTVEQVLAGPPLMHPGGDMSPQKNELEEFLHRRVYRHPQVITVRRNAQEMLGAMFQGYCQNPELLPESYRQRIPIHGTRRCVADYLAGMTDRFAQQEFQRLFQDK